MIALILCLIVAAIHAYFLVLEMFRWEHPRTRKVFGMSAELAAQTKAMAANQGLYNGFLSAGIVFALWQGDAGYAMLVFTLLCVVVAGVYGAMSVTKAAFVAQTIPATLALLAFYFNI